MGGLSREEKEKVEVHLRLAPGRIRDRGSATPMMVTTTGRSVCSFSGSRAGASGATLQGEGCRM
jgi:hypothetical protein